MAIRFIVTDVAIIFSPELNACGVFGFPLGCSMGAQVSLIIFVVLILNCTLGVSKAGGDCGIAEETG